MGRSRPTADATDFWCPGEIAIPGKVIGIAGAGHTAIWTQDGKLNTFGAGTYGQLGHGGDLNARSRLAALSSLRLGCASIDLRSLDSEIILTMKEIRGNTPSFTANT